MRTFVAVAVSVLLLLPGAAVGVGAGPGGVGPAAPGLPGAGPADSGPPGAGPAVAGTTDAGVTAPTADPQVGDPAVGVGNATGQRVVVAIAVEEDGDARWNVSMLFPLRNDTERRAFERLAGEFERREAGLGVSTDLFERLVARAEVATGREMAVVDPSTNATVANGTGVLSFRFTWTGFAAKRGDELVVRDVFASERVTGMLSLAENQTLVVRPPDGYLVSDASIGPTNGTLVWTGPRRFEPGSVAVVYRSASPGFGPAALLDRLLSGGFDDASPVLLGGAVAVLAVLAVGLLAYLAVRRGRPSGPRDGSGPAVDGRPGSGPTAPGRGDGGESSEDVATGADAAGDPAAGSPAGDEPTPTTGSGAPAPADSTPSPTAGGTTASNGRGGDAGGSGAGGDAITSEGGSADPGTESVVVREGRREDVDLDLLSDEERILLLLDERGGRMKQSRIVEQTGWSNSKVSVLLSSMAAEERVEKLRIGRENLISLPDVDPKPDTERVDSD